MNRLHESGKVPLPNKMYTKPVDVNQPHTFGKKPKLGVSYEPLQWNAFFDHKEKINGVVPLYSTGTHGHVFLCLHGAGHSALTFAALAKYLKSSSIVLAFDFRGHGDHHRDNETDLSEETLINDTIEVVKYVHTKYPNSSIIMVGHSMGGSIATKATSKILKDHQADEWHK
jgi:protein phosphatase methylesterase 1